MMETKKPVGTTLGGPNSGTILGGPNTSYSTPLAVLSTPKLIEPQQKKGKKVNPVEIYKKAQESSSDYSSSEEDYSENEDEGKEGYKKGGYHPVSIGDEFKENRYKALQKLGWGHFSTVWLCLDKEKNENVALKIVKSAKSYTEAAADEIKLLKKISENDPERKKCVVHLWDSFDHRGPNGRHVVMAFEVLGSNLLDLIKYYDYKGIPTKAVKSICKQVLIGLDYLHTQCGIIHTDLKPENVLLSITLPQKQKRKGSEPEEPRVQTEQPSTTTPSYIKYTALDENDPSTYVSKIADFGNACWVDHHFTNDIQTRQYRAPEVILGMKYDTGVDMWSMGCMVFELLTGDLLFEPKDGTNFDKNDDHLAQMTELLGKLPKQLSVNSKYAREFFNRKGDLKFIRNLNYWSLDRVLIEKYHRTEAEAKEISSFILPMLNYFSNRRATPAQMLKHSWLEDAPLLSDQKKENK